MCSGWLARGRVVVSWERHAVVETDSRLSAVLHLKPIVLAHLVAVQSLGMFKFLIFTDIFFVQVLKF